MRGRIYRLKRDTDMATNHNCGPYLNSESNQNCKTNDDIYETIVNLIIGYIFDDMKVLLFIAR